MKAVALVGGQVNQRALCHKLAGAIDLRAIVLSRNVPKRAKTRRERVESLLLRAQNRIFGRPFARAWASLQATYDARFPDWPDVERVAVRNVNDPETLEVLARIQPDLVIVSGTNLVGRAVIEAGQRGRGIVNLHTGISPYVKGGPNCTNWCLATRRFDLIGNTIMWLDLGIDTGALVATERTPLTGREPTLDALHLAVMEHAHDLYVRSVKAIAAGRAVARHPQSAIGEGHTYYTRDWNAQAIVRARAGWREYRASGGRWLRPDVTLVSLPQE